MSDYYQEEPGFSESKLLTSPLTYLRYFPELPTFFEIALKVKSVNKGQSSNLHKAEKC